MTWRLIAGLAQTVSIGATHQESTPIVEGIAVLIAATSDCHIRIGKGAVAVTTDTLIKAAYPPLLFRTFPGEVVSVIQDSANGSLSVTEMTE